MDHLAAWAWPILGPPFGHIGDTPLARQCRRGCPPEIRKAHGTGAGIGVNAQQRGAHALRRGRFRCCGDSRNARTIWRARADAQRRGLFPRAIGRRRRNTLNGLRWTVLLAAAHGACQATTAADRGTPISSRRRSSAPSPKVKLSHGGPRDARLPRHARRNRRYQTAYRRNHKQSHSKVMISANGMLAKIMNPSRRPIFVRLQDCLSSRSSGARFPARRTTQHDKPRPDQWTYRARQERPEYRLSVFMRSRVLIVDFLHCDEAQAPPRQRCWLHRW